MAVLITNNAAGRLAGGISATQNTISLQAGQGAKFPSPSGGDWFPVTIIRSDGQMEIVHCTARANDLLTVLRGQESTIAREFLAGVVCELRVTAAAFDDIRSSKGDIKLWGGAINELPVGWTLCDGTNGTPDLRDKFVPGAGGAYAVGQTGGADSVTLTAAQMPTHNHTAGTASAGAHSHGGSTGSNGGHNHGGSTGANGEHNHTATTGSAGSHSHSGSTNTTGSHTHRQIAARYSTATSNLNYEGKENHPSATQNTSSAGSHSHSLSINSNGSHTHSLTTSTQAAHSHTISSDGEHTHTISSDGGHTHTMTVGNAGSGESHENRPAFYALAYIMKL